MSKVLDKIKQLNEDGMSVEFRSARNMTKLTDDGNRLALRVHKVVITPSVDGEEKQIVSVERAPRFKNFKDSGHLKMDPEDFVVLVLEQMEDDIKDAEEQERENYGR